MRELAEPVVVAHGLDLVDVEWQSTHHGKVLRVVIERPLDEGAPPSNADAELEEAIGLSPIAGVALEDCVAVSRDLSTILDVEGMDVAGLPQGRYNLEVSSPGLDRPLRTARDFRRQVGRLAKIKLLEPAADGQRVLRGTLVHADEAGIRMTVDGKPHEVRLDNIDVAKLVFELPQQPKPRSSKRSRKGQSQQGKTRAGSSSKGGSKRGKAK